MAQAQAYDERHFQDLEWPYDRAAGELSDEPRIVAGQNTYITLGKKLARRPATKLLNSITSLNMRCARLEAVETLETPSKIYLLGSFYNATAAVYEIWWLRLDGVAATWTKLSDVRSINLSLYPHEMTVSRGLMYIKGFPSAGTGEKLGTVIFDGTGGTVVVRFWGLLGPQTAAHVVNPSTWSAQVNAHAYTILYGWKYAYAFVTNTGHVSNRSDLEQNIDLDPSDTGNVGEVLASAGHCPEVVVHGHADTSYVPYLNIYRTTDGGGTFYFLKQIPNPGDADVTFVDKYFESGPSGGVFEDPMDDQYLDTTRVAPSLTSNSPPPTCIAPKVTGVDAIVRSTPICTYAGRIWMAIGNYIFFSGLEEIPDGIPEEAWPSGLNGNFFKVNYPVTNLVPSADAIYVLTVRASYRIVGTNRETFNLNPWLADIGHPWGHPRAARAVGDALAFLSHDNRVIYARAGTPTVISDPLWVDLRDAINGLAEIEIRRWTDLEKDWLIVAAHRADDPDQSRQWIMDMKRFEPSGHPFWFPPWDINATACLSCRPQETIFSQRAIFSIWDGDNSVLVYLDPTARTEQDYQLTGDRPITWYFNTFLVQNPPGNHVNGLTQQVRTTVFDALQFERSLWAGDSDPRVYFYLDDFWSDPIDSKPGYEPTRRLASKSYRTFLHPLNRACQRVAAKLQNVKSVTPMELHNLTFFFRPNSGA